jgi:hypothetical protein
MALVHVPQRRRQLRRRQGAGRNSRGCGSTCLTISCLVCWTMMALWLFNFSNYEFFRQPPTADWIEFDYESSDNNNNNNNNNNVVAQAEDPPTAIRTSTIQEERKQPTMLELQQQSVVPPCDDPSCQDHRRQRLQRTGGVDLLSYTDIMAAVQAAKQALLQTLSGTDQYGGLAHPLFQTSESLVGAGNATVNPSRHRLRDKLQRKLLQVQLEITREDHRPDESADAAESDSQSSSSTMQDNDTYTTLVWATAGHGRSAGLGNLASESYTSVFEQAAGPVFRAAGIALEARNYGWNAGSGNMETDKSGPELALCLDSVYGVDVDILAWDFGDSVEREMQQSDRELVVREHDHAWRRRMFWARAALQANRPAVVAMHLNDPNDVSQPETPQDIYGTINSESENDHMSSPTSTISHPIQQELDQLGAHGLTALAWNPAVVTRLLKDVIPDAAELLPDEDDTVPAMVRFMKCGGLVEAGPVCEDEKFSDHAGKACGQRRDRDASNPGWYVHLTVYV